MSNIALAVAQVVTGVSYLALACFAAWGFRKTGAIHKYSVKAVSMGVSYTCFFAFCAMTHVFTLADLPVVGLYIACGVASAIGAVVTILYMPAVVHLMTTEHDEALIIYKNCKQLLMRSFDTVAICNSESMVHGRCLGKEIREPVFPPHGVPHRENAKCCISSETGEWIKTVAVIDDFGLTGYVRPKRSPDEFLIIASNISAEVHAITTEREHLQEILNAKVAVAMSMAHDLRSPLMSIEFLTTVIQAQCTCESTKDSIEEVFVAIEILKVISAHTLDIGVNLGAINSVPSPTWVSIPEFVKKLKVISRGYEQQVPMSYEVDPELDTVYVDRSWLWQISVNFLSNATRYAEEGRIVFRIFRATEKGTICLEVLDTGPGLSDAAKATVFKPSLSKLDKKSKTGLGLSTVNIKARAMGGECSVRDNDEDGRGCVFRIEFPDTDAKPVLPGRPGTKGNGKVLIVDDSIIMRRLLSRALNDENVECERSGAKALEKLKAEVYDVTFMDQMLEDGEGTAILQQLRDFENAHGLPRQIVCIMSGNVLNKTPSMDYVVQKPFDLDAFKTIVDRHHMVPTQEGNVKD